MCVQFCIYSTNVVDSVQLLAVTLYHCRLQDSKVLEENLFKKLDPSPKEM